MLYFNRKFLGEALATTVFPQAEKENDYGTGYSAKA